MGSSVKILLLQTYKQEQSGTTNISGLNDSRLLQLGSSFLKSRLRRKARLGVCLPPHAYARRESRTSQWFEWHRSQAKMEYRGKDIGMQVLRKAGTCRGRNTPFKASNKHYGAGAINHQNRKRSLSLLIT